MAKRKEINELIDWAQRQGWTVGRTRKGHLKFQCPGRRTVFTSHSPSDHRTVRNAKAELRRHT